MHGDPYLALMPSTGSWHQCLCGSGTEDVQMTPCARTLCKNLLRRYIVPILQFSGDDYHAWDIVVWGIFTWWFSVYWSHQMYSVRYIILQVVLLSTGEVFHLGGPMSWEESKFCRILSLWLGTWSFFPCPAAIQLGISVSLIIAVFWSTWTHWGCGRDSWSHLKIFRKETLSSFTLGRVIGAMAGEDDQSSPITDQTNREVMPLRSIIRNREIIWLLHCGAKGGVLPLIYHIFCISRIL